MRTFRALSSQFANTQALANSGTFAFHGESRMEAKLVSNSATTGPSVFLKTSSARSNRGLSQKASRRLFLNDNAAVHDDNSPGQAEAASSVTSTTQAAEIRLNPFCDSTESFPSIGD